MARKLALDAIFGLFVSCFLWSSLVSIFMNTVATNLVPAIVYMYVLSNTSIVVIKLCVGSDSDP